ncbi:MAG: hypothetical protein QUV06_12555 [Cyanobium sp. CZS 48M]|nr:hypothetical protein [Cyanobium sp. CZS48M]
MNPQPRSSDAAGQDAGSAEALAPRLKRWIDTVLVFNVFLVFAGAIWFALAVVLHSQHVEAPLQLLQRLWDPLFTPAIGLLMGAALLSGLLGWWQRQGLSRGRGNGT